MSSNYNLQDLVRCDLCETFVPSMYCEVCHFNLCSTCVSVHILNEPTKHKLVPFGMRRINLLCSNEYDNQSLNMTIERVRLKRIF